MVKKNKDIQNLRQEKWGKRKVWVYRESGRIVSWQPIKKGSGEVAKLLVANRAKKKIKFEKPTVQKFVNVDRLDYKIKPNLTKKQPFVFTTEFEIRYKGKLVGRYWGSTTKQQAGTTNAKKMFEVAKKNATLQAVADEKFFEDYKTSRIPQGFTAKEINNSTRWQVYVDKKQTRFYA